MAYLALCCFAGLRLGETAAIQVPDIDFLRKQLHVRRRVQRAAKARLEIRPPKYGSERTVFVADELLEILARRCEACGPTWLFTGQGDEPPHQNTIGYRWRTTCTRTGVIGYTLHSMRHWYASGLIEAGCDVVTIQKAMGHASASTTLSTYAWLWPSAVPMAHQGLRPHRPAHRQTPPVQPRRRRHLGSGTGGGLMASGSFPTIWMFRGLIAGRLDAFSLVTWGVGV
jgi:integrase